MTVTEPEVSADCEGRHAMVESKTDSCLGSKNRAHMESNGGAQCLCKTDTKGVRDVYREAMTCAQGTARRGNATQEMKYGSVH